MAPPQLDDETKVTGPAAATVSSPYKYGAINVNNNDNDDDSPTKNAGSSSDEESLTPLIVERVKSRPPTSTKSLFKAIALCLTSVALVAAGVLWAVHGGGDMSKSYNTDDSSQDDFSPLSSPIEMGVRFIDREQTDASPSKIWGNARETMGPLPTNSWFLNLVSHRAWSQPDESTRVYTVPYIVDTAPAAHSISLEGKMTSGIRVHWPTLQANAGNIQVVDDWKNGISLGTTDPHFVGSTKSRYHVLDDESSGTDNKNEKNSNNGQQHLSHLGLVLEWSGIDENSMRKSNTTTTTTTTTTSSNSTSTSSKRRRRRMVSPIVRGMPYATMQYYGGVLPTLYSYNGPFPHDQAIVIDNGDSSSQQQEFQCGVRKSSSQQTTDDEATDGTPSTTDGTTSTSSSSSSSTTSNSSSSNTTSTSTTTALVQKEVRLHFIGSDFTWAVFFSQPVRIRCDVSEGDEKLRDFSLEVVSIESSSSRSKNDDDEEEPQDDDDDDDDDDTPLTVRLAMLDQCTTGHGNIQSHCKAEKKHNATALDKKKYAQLLREAVDVVPFSPDIQFRYPSSSKSSKKNDDDDDDSSTTTTTIDWDARTTSSSSSSKSDLLMFAMPHHQDLLSSNEKSSSASMVNTTDTCFQTFHGRTCLVRGSSWQWSQALSTKENAVSFYAARPPTPEFIPALAKALQQDVHYKLSDNMKRAAADTYFSGKILARLARVIILTHEMQTLATPQGDSSTRSSSSSSSMYRDADEKTIWSASQAASNAHLPSEKDLQMAIDELKKGVEPWLKTTAEAPYIYDNTWGGMVNCGCRYVGKGPHGYCNNTFPDCPALASVNEDFGNGYYNDHHYHYGYHVYAAAVVSKFDPEWAVEYFDRVMLYIRDFANPYESDPYFVQFRQKDWFLGSSWASGIVSAENSPHGRNEESSSEAIAAYEGVALYGSVMVDIFSSDDYKHAKSTKLETARLVRDAGQLLTSTEVEATNRYWHVWSSHNHVNTYPAGYKQPVVGMLYDTMASFQTWFAPEAVVSYGIQLMPLTPIAEQRDDPTWAATLYPKYNQSCEEAGDFCIDNGWSILQAGLCATAGNQQDALKQVLAIPPKVFDSLGGVGNSLSNTIWYIATRKPFHGGGGV